MSGNAIQKVKTILKVLLIIVIIALIALGFYGYYYIKKTYAIVKIEAVQPMLHVNNSQYSASNQDYKISDLKESVKIEEEKIGELEKSVMILKATKAINSVTSSNDYTALLIALNSFEQKLEHGGNTINDTIKLKTFSAKIPEISIIISRFENVSSLPSKDELKNSFNDYVKAVKVFQIASENTKLSKLKAQLSKIFTILDASDPKDAMLVQMKEQMKENNFIGAFETSKQINVKTKETEVFLTDLENVAKVENGLNQIYSFILESLNK